jgi:hypothetical protein
MKQFLRFGARHIRFDRSTELLVLSPELDVAVKDLLLLFRCEVMYVDHDLTLAEKRKSPFLEIIPCPLVM